MQDKRAQWERIKAEKPDLAEFALELSREFGKLGGIDETPFDEGWIQPELEYRGKARTGRY